MHRKNHSAFWFFIGLSLVLTELPASSRAQEQGYETCAGTFQCGRLGNVSFPFWGGNRPAVCGHPGFQLDCSADDPIINISSSPYKVLQINNSTSTLTIGREDILTNICPRIVPRNASLDFSLFNYILPDANNVTLYYNCSIDGGRNPPPPSQLLPSRFDCSIDQNTPNSFGIFTARDLSRVNLNLSLSAPISCTSNIFVTVNQTSYQTLDTPTATQASLLAAIAGGFSVAWDNTNCSRCTQSQGRCGFNGSSFACFCANTTSTALTCENTGSSSGAGGGQSPTSIWLPIVGAILAGVGIGWSIFFCRQRKRRLSAEAAPQTVSKDISTPPSSKGLTTVPSTHFTKSIPSYPSSQSDFGRGSTYFGVQIFTYDELEQATDNFDQSKELGDGGFGTVYYGQLHDGRIVAVKRLYENNFKRVEQFMNEVEILTRLRHDNLVTLFGCTSKRSRELLLVYEYIPNGTVADHLHGKRAKSGLLSWPVRLNIAIETADALAYLHRSDIIHRDVKTNNILLDNDFHVKVADFGLSKLFPHDVTHVSTAPQGTPGYVDPEYYQCYQLTEKSDVYSFGVVLIELISSLQAVDTNRHRHDINLANMAINKIQNHTLHELVDPSLGFETNSIVRRMTTLVAELAFRCLQQERDMRPSMVEVLENLRGIQNEELNVQKAEVVDIVIDDVGLKNNVAPPSPDKFSSSTPNSSA